MAYGSVRLQINGNNCQVAMEVKVVTVDILIETQIFTYGISIRTVVLVNMI